MFLKYFLLLTFAISSTVAASREFKVLSWNLILLPKIVKNTFHDERLPLIVKALEQSDYDFILLQEVFTEDGYKTISRALNKKGYFNSGHPYRSFLKPVSSGIVTFSKYPLTEIENTPLSHLSGSDFFSSKTIVSATAQISEGLKVRIVNTHLQSQSTEKAIHARVNQLKQIEAGLNSNLPTILSGDFNMDNNVEAEKNYLSEFTIKNKFTSLFPKTELKDTVDCERNKLKTYVDTDCKYKRYLDYIFINHLGEVKDLKIKNFEGIYPLDGTSNLFPLSDHYAIEATVTI